jgi:hypothetical protein
MIAIDLLYYLCCLRWGNTRQIYIIPLLKQSIQSEDNNKIDLHQQQQQVVITNVNAFNQELYGMVINYMDATMLLIHLEFLLPIINYDVDSGIVTLATHNRKLLSSSSSLINDLSEIDRLEMFSLPLVCNR